MHIQSDKRLIQSRPRSIILTDSSFLRVIYRESDQAWQVERAKEVAIWRTSFVLRFECIVGVAPLTYLLDSRMQFSRPWMCEGSMSFSQLGLCLGYTTEGAFSDAFKRTTGMAIAKRLCKHASVDYALGSRGVRISASA